VVRRFRLTVLLRTSTAAGLLLAAGFSGSAWAGQWRATPRISLSETYTDNVDLTSTSRKDDVVITASPGINIYGQGARGVLSLDYTANYLDFLKKNKTDLRHNLLGLTRWELIEDLFSISANASISQQFLDRTKAFSVSDQNLTDNRRNVQTIGITPEFRHRFGSLGTASLKYEFSYVDISRNAELVAGQTVSDTLTNRVTFNFNSGTRFTRLDWSVLASYSDTGRSTGVTGGEHTRVVFDAEYRIRRQIGILGSIGYEKITDQLLVRAPNNLTWDIGLRLEPGPRTSLNVRYGRRFRGDIWGVDGSYQISPRSFISLSYDERIDSFQSAFSQRFNNATVSDNGAVVDPATGLPFSPNAPDFSFSNNPTRTKNFHFTFSSRRGRNTYNLTTSHLRRLTDISGFGEKNVSITASVARNFTRRATGNISGGYTNRVFSGTLTRVDDYYYLISSFNYQLGTALDGTLRYALSKRTSTDVIGRLKENSITASLTARF
jgi:uncharacterized protein (PEP-CTERM system associated)